jgi:serine/threonine protein kinase
VDGFPHGPQWAPGTAIGDYEIVEHIASGGMAEVYAAVPRTGGDPVVLKAMLPTILSNEEFVRLFLDEAQLIATLHHRNIGQIYDRGEARGTHYFVMEYVLGPSCREILNRAVKSDIGHVPLSHAIDICCDIADALHYAHMRRGVDGNTYGIVHRDISHSNVLVTYEGVTKLIDFGVAKSSMRSTETKVGSLKGKVRYMSPEQIRGEAIDRRSDLFALGVVLWEMTTGQRLFRAANEATTMHKILYEDARRPSDAIAGYPPELERIVLTALSRDPQQRQSSTEEMGHQLADFASKAGLARGGLPGYLQTLFGEEIEQDRARFQLLRRRRSSISSAPSAASLRPLAAFSPTSRRHSITTVPPPMSGALLAGGQLAGGQLAGGQLAGGALAPAPALHAESPLPAFAYQPPILPSERSTTRPRSKPRQTTRERLSLLLFALVVIGIIVTGLALSRRTAHSPPSSTNSIDEAAPPSAPSRPGGSSPARSVDTAR